MRTKRCSITIVGGSECRRSVLLRANKQRGPHFTEIYERLRRAITTLAMLPSESLSEQDLR